MAKVDAHKDEQREAERKRNEDAESRRAGPGIHILKRLA